MVSYAIEPQINVDIEVAWKMDEWAAKVRGIIPMPPLSPRGDALEFRACLLHNQHTITGNGNHP